MRRCNYELSRVMGYEKVAYSNERYNIRPWSIEKWAGIGLPVEGQASLRMVSKFYQAVVSPHN